MAVTKRIRYEVLKRDNHTCRYCGAAAPHVKLTVDHVTPVALGGTDDPSNLVAACRDCNAGKASTSPDSALVADVREDAMRHAALVREAYAVLVERLGAKEDYIDEWAEAYTFEPLPQNWRESIGRWFEMGVPIELLVDAAKKACGKTKTFRGDDRFKYMCGIVWSQVRMVDELAENYRAIEGSFLSNESLDAQRYEAWCGGREAGYRAAATDLARIDPVSAVVDSHAFGPNLSAVA